ncbi:MAG: L-lactate permease [Chloroflexota bacterium]
MNNVLLTGLAALPILTILVLMLGARWPAAKAGAVGLVVALFLAWLAFGYGQRTYSEIGSVFATVGALSEAVITAATILWIIIPALCLHQLQLRSGAIDTLRSAMGRLSDDPRIIALLVAWFFALFIEGAAGFGTSIALAAPFLVSVGFGPVAAVTIVLIGHSVGVSFGAVGTPVIPQIETTGLSGAAIAQSTGLYHTLLGWIMLGSAMLVVSRELKDQGKGNGGRSIWGWTALAAVFFLVPFFLIAQFIGPELPTLGGAFVGGLGFVTVFGLVQSRVGGIEKPVTPVSDDATPRMGLLAAASPYLILVLLVLITRLIPPLQELLSGIVWRYALFDTFSVSFQPLYQPGTLLFLSFLLGALCQRTSLTLLREAVVAALGQIGGVTVALIAMLGLARIMVYAGMIDILAQTAADTAGPFWPLFAPFVGMLGTFVTGSATASNILFTDLQLSTAQNLELSVVSTVGLQGFGAAVGNIICPHNIIAGGATVGLRGEEGAVLRGTLPACLLYATLGGVIAFIGFG